MNGSLEDLAHHEQRACIIPPWPQFWHDVGLVRTREHQARKLVEGH